MAIDISPCPFCGSHRLHIHRHLMTHGVSCESCRSQGPRYVRMEDAVVEWNHTSKQLQQAKLMKEHFLQAQLNQMARLAASKEKEKVKAKCD